MENRNNITEFILLGFSQQKEVEILFFIIFLLSYIAILAGNLLIMISVTCSQLIQQPMYFFLSFLSLSDLCYTSTVTPKLVIDLLAEKKTISYNGCMTQLFTMHFFGGIEVFILTGMAYDRYVAICKPLHYTVIMSRRTCGVIMAASCFGGFLHSFGQFMLAIFLPYCGPNEIDHYFCDVYPLLKLACTDTSRIGLLVIANSGLMGLVILVVLLISYAVILYTVKSYSRENRRKALSTCTSHITVVVLFFAPLLFVYIRPATTLPEDKVFALFYTIIAPMLNPLIYTLRNNEMKNAMKKLWSQIMGRRRNRLKDIPASHHRAC
ncbi:PREDICTED: olfactory receptor 4P4-like [Chrysochloris asiatica]|uniref:Olfactory receptor n=1 Tax=Chrysochloris asiatica TaxID=185453 RepID=A0A9B0X1D1_CHRAS|nr:PREDICTED: olfactory receptor 4P4-like [Chrysochloris asiatica]